MRSLRILSWNVNGIRAVYRKGALEWFFEKKPDILCLQETKADPDQVPPDLKEIDDYFSFFESGHRKGYSGVGLYSKQQPGDLKTGLGIERFDNEGRIIIADYKVFTLLNIYFPNGKASAERLAYKMDFYDAFLDYVDRLTAQGKHVVICGDVNTAHKEIDLARPKENEKISGFLPEERAWIDKFLAHGYVDTFRMFNQEADQYTWWTARGGARSRNVGWRIDYFFVDEAFKDRVKAAFIWPEIMGSDHCPIGIDLAVGE